MYGTSVGNFGKELPAPFMWLISSEISKYTPGSKTEALST